MKTFARQTSEALMHLAKGWFFGPAGAQWSPGVGRRMKGAEAGEVALEGHLSLFLSPGVISEHIVGAQKAFAE